MVNFDNLEVVDYLRSGALIIAFFATVFADKKGESSVWLNADALAGGAFGVGLYLFPNVLLQYQVTFKPDPLIEQVVRIIGASLIGMSIIWYYSSGSKDKAVSGAWLLHRSVAGLSLFLLMFGAKGHKEYSFKDQHCTFGLLACGLWTVGNIIHLFRENSLGSIRREGVRKDSTSVAIILDVLFVGASCIFLIAQPEMTFKLLTTKTLTPFHFYLSTLLHVFLLSVRIYALMALNFSNENDKKAYFKGILWFMLMTLPWLWLFQWQQKTPFRPTCFVNGMHLVFGLNAMRAVGCLKWLPGCCGCMKILKGE